MNTTSRTNLGATATLLAVMGALAAGITMGQMESAPPSAKPIVRNVDEFNRIDASLLVPAEAGGIRRGPYPRRFSGASIFDRYRR